MISFLKLLPNISLYFIVWGLLAYWLKRKKHKMSTLFIVLGIALFLVCSTNYLPKQLIASIEKTYSPIELQRIDNSKTYYIHVLGAGASTDPRLPPSMGLNSGTLSRLVEGIRIYTYLDHGVLVTSAATKKELKSQAELSKETAVSLGVKEADIEMLEAPTTTLEEALAFKAQFGTNKNIILVTSAIHMPRAAEIFIDQDLNVIPAPSGYIYKEGGNSYNGITFPSFNSLELINTYQRAKLKEWYYRFNK